MNSSIDKITPGISSDIRFENISPNDNSDIRFENISLNNNSDVHRNIYSEKTAPDTKPDACPDFPCGRSGSDLSAAYFASVDDCARSNIPTPYYLVDKRALDEYADFLIRSMRSNWGKIQPSFSVKTNSLPWLLAHLHVKGFYAEIVSAEEYDLVRRIGYTPDQMIYNGPLKDRDVFRTILMAGGYINIDSHIEVQWLQELSREYPGQTFRELSGIIQTLKNIPGVTVAGLHLHLTTKSRNPSVTAMLCHMCAEVAGSLHLHLSYVDVGGGFLGGVKGRPDYSDYFPGIRRELEKAFDPNQVTLIAEPGVSLVSSSFFFVTSVHDVRKVRDNWYLVTDGSRLNMNPQITRRWYPHHVLRKATASVPVPRQMVCGATCMEYDRLFPIENEPLLHTGDKIVYDLAGGYTMCLNPNFIHYLPAVYILQTDGSLFTARSAWTNDEVMARNYWEK